MNTFLVLVCLIAAVLYIKRIVLFRIGRALVKDRAVLLHTLSQSEWRSDERMIEEMTKEPVSFLNYRGYKRIILHDTRSLAHDGLVEMRKYIPWKNEKDVLPRDEYRLTHDGHMKRTATSQSGSLNQHRMQLT